MKVRIRMDGVLFVLEAFEVKNGLRQGCCKAGLVLFKLYTLAEKSGEH